MSAKYVNNDGLLYIWARLKAIFATKDELATKEDTIAAGTTSQYWRGDKSFQTLNKSAVGLGNVDNTSDASKPVSTATSTALGSKADKVGAGAENHVAQFDSTGNLKDGKGVNGTGNLMALGPSNAAPTSFATFPSNNTANGIAPTTTADMKAALGIAAIEGKIPSTATTANQLADKAFVNSSISAMAADKCTKTAAGNTLWASLAEINAASTFYINGAVATPARNDYAIYDNGTEQWRAVYTGSQWENDFKVGNTLTAAQQAALDSGVTATKVAAYDGYAAGKQNTLNRTVGGNDNATGTVTDTGGNLSVPVPVTTVAAAASSVQSAVGTRSLRAQVKILIDNIAYLFINKADKSEIPAIPAPDTWYGTCGVAAGTAAKTAAITSFVRTTGTVVALLHTTANSATTPTLNVNSTGAAAIKVGSLTASTDIAWGTNTVITYMFDGTYWLVISIEAASGAYATCSTAATTAAKVLTVQEGQTYSRRRGFMLSVLFTAGFTINAAAATIAIPGLATSSIGKNNTAAITCNLPAGTTVLFMFNGTYWHWVSDDTALSMVPLTNAEIDTIIASA